MKNLISNKVLLRVVVRKFTKVFENPNAVLCMMILTSFTLMLSGLLDALVQHSPSMLPGPSTLMLSSIRHIPNSQFGLLSMSIGLLLFLLIPSLRVLLGLEKFIRRREVVNIIVALIVLIELAVSITI